MLDRKRVLVSLLSPPMGHIRLNSLKRGETRRFLEQASLCDGTCVFLRLVYKSAHSLWFEHRFNSPGWALMAGPS